MNHEKKSQKKRFFPLFKFCIAAKDQNLLEEFFSFILTLEEQEMLSSRCDIILALLKGKETQREIAKRCGVSISQITRGSNALKQVPKNLFSLLDQFAKEV